MHVQEFNIREMFSNSKGKTSLALVLCGIFGVSAAIGFIACGVVLIVDAWHQASVKTDISGFSMQCVALATLVFGYCATRRLTNDKDITTKVEEVAQ